MLNETQASQPCYLCPASQTFQQRMPKTKASFLRTKQNDLDSPVMKNNHADFWKDIGKIGIGKERRKTVPMEVTTCDGNISSEKSRYLEKLFCESLDAASSTPCADPGIFVRGGGGGGGPGQSDKKSSHSVFFCFFCFFFSAYFTTAALRGHVKFFFISFPRHRISFPRHNYLVPTR